MRHVSFGITWQNSTDPILTNPIRDFSGDFQVYVLSEDSAILEIVNSSYPECIRSRDEPKNFSFTVKGVFLGYTKVKVDLQPAPKGCMAARTNQSLLGSFQSTKDFALTVTVIRAPSLMINLVTAAMAALVAFNYINMGVQLDLHCIGKVLKKPIGPAIGFACQFLFMPLASFGISMLLLDDDSLRLGLFTLGCSPGGSMSNFWTLLFNGDVNLSITMTFISTIAALAMMPLWIFTLGASLFRDHEATIPYINLAGSLVLLTFPLGIGILIRQYSPRLSKVSRKIIKPFTLICVIVSVCFGLYVNQFVFKLFTWQVVLAGISIAWGGYCFGALMAWLFRLERAQIMAVSIETAFQNPAVAFVMLVLSLPQPGADLSSVPVIAQLMLTGLPMWALLILSKIYHKVKVCCEEQKQIETPEIDTVQKAYLAVQTDSPDDSENAILESSNSKVNIVRFSTIQ
ncbi:solute carrier family 10 member 6 [Caerostris darwini]|uniref:Solute carrier family 10 member 6 n=1 Tax=Caerostris darwini TaxID=1538125 RepID=A0AAV4NCD3_9ARAC|nr:solute carrier family 10 member 6 [Caerostris darwini]